MKVELKRLKIYARMSEETTAFVADVWVDGKKVGIAKNDGHGGETHVDVPLEMLQRMMRHGEITLNDGVRWSNVEPTEGQRNRVSVTEIGAKRFGIAAGTLATIVASADVRDGDATATAHVKVETDRSARGASASFTCEWPTDALQPSLVGGGACALVDRLVEQHERDKQAAKIAKIDAKEVVANAKRGWGTLRWEHKVGPGVTDYVWMGLRKGDDPAAIAKRITAKRGATEGEVTFKVLA